MSGVSFASIVRIPVTSSDSREPKVSRSASLKGKIKCSQKLVTNKDQGDTKRPYMDENLVYKPKNSRICKVRVQSKRQPNMAQYVPTLNRFAMLANDSNTERENNINMDFHSKVHSNSPRAEIPVNICTNETKVSTSKSTAKTRLDKVNKENCKTTGKQVRKEWVLSENADKYDLELRFKPRHREKIENAKNNGTFQRWNTQASDKYEFIPLGDLIKPQSDIRNPTIADIKLLHSTVKNGTTHNFLGAQVQVKGQLDPDKWEMRLHDYWDVQLCSLIRYGFPLDFDSNSHLLYELINHSSATHHHKDVKAYLEEEKHFNAIYGPYSEPPLENMHFSPFLTREKPGAKHRRVIVDLSFPHGSSVNAGVQPESYLGTPFLLTLPTIDTITQKVKENGKGSLLYKIDLSRAFRHVKLDPKDYNLLGLHLQGYYFDSCLPFGFKHGSAIFQRISDAIRYIMAQSNFQVTNYIDDIIGHAVCSQACDSFDYLYNLLIDLGFDISENKVVTPSTKVTCLGVEINSENFTVSITEEKLQDIIKLCELWSEKTHCTKKELQSLLGKLLYITKCVKSSRFFLNRMLELLRSANKQEKIILTKEFKQDLNWFQEFVPKFNGTAFFVHNHIHHEIELDACLQGMGARWGDQVYAIKTPTEYDNMTIVHYEMFNIMVAVRTWGFFWSGKTVRIHCDNEAVVTVLSTGKTKDLTLAAIARNIWLTTAEFDICLKTVHIRGKDNAIADSLSRWFTSQVHKNRVQTLLPYAIWNNIPSNATVINWNI